MEDEDGMIGVSEYELFRYRAWRAKVYLNLIHFEA